MWIARLRDEQGGFDIPAPSVASSPSHQPWGEDSGLRALSVWEATRGCEVRRTMVMEARRGRLTGQGSARRESVGAPPNGGEGVAPLRPYRGKARSGIDLLMEVKNKGRRAIDAGGVRREVATTRLSAKSD